MSTSYLICITDPTYKGYTDFCQQRFLEKYKAKSELRAHKMLEKYVCESPI